MVLQVKKVEDTVHALKCVIGDNGLGLFLRVNDESSIYIDAEGQIHSWNSSLEDILREAPGRTPVYEGESITLSF